MLTTVRNLENYFKNLFVGPHYHYHLDLPKMMLPDQSDINIEYLNWRSRDDLHIFDVSDEPYRERIAERFAEVCAGLEFKKFLILSHSLKYNNNVSFNNIIYFPHNYFDPVYFWDQETALKNINSYDRKYFVSCLNAQARMSRIYNYIKLKQKTYNNELLLSLHNSPTHAGNDLNSPADWIPEDYWSEWNAIRFNLPKLKENDLDIGHSAYHDAYINLVTETFVQPFEQFFSEKVYKPISCGQLFIIIGSTGAVANLRSMGFDTFDDIIDHSRYDFRNTWRSRIDIIHEMLDELKDLNWSKIYEETKLRRLANVRHFFSGLAVLPYARNIANRMSYISKDTYYYDHHLILGKHDFRSPYVKLPSMHHLLK